MDKVIRNVDVILDDVKNARASNNVIDVSLEQLMLDMEVIMGETIVDLSKFKDNNKAAGKRVRKYTLALNTLGYSFRKASV